MLDLPENELFSAYIDGELTAEEQAEIERILSENPDARQLVDELRSLSSSLQSLPRYKLDEDLASRVLQQAEREMLSEPAVPLPGFHQVDVPKEKRTSWSRRLLRPRNFAWPGVAVAVAIIFMLNEPEQPGGNDVAANSTTEIIEPLDNVLTVEAAQGSPSTVAADAGEDNRPMKPKAVEAEAGTPGPLMVAEKSPEDQPEASDRATDRKGESDQLLVLQCQLAEGQVGHEALADLLKQAGVDVGGAIAEDGSPIELTLTTNQVNQVIAQFRTDSELFSDFAFRSGGKMAAPQIPSAAGPDGSHGDKTPVAEPGDGKEPPEATLHVHGTFTIQPKGSPRVDPSATTSVDSGRAATRIDTKAAPSTKPRSIPIEDDRIYRVRFVIEPHQKPAKAKSSGSQ